MQGSFLCHVGWHSPQASGDTVSFPPHQDAVVHKTYVAAFQTRLSELTCTFLRILAAHQGSVALDLPAQCDRFKSLLDDAAAVVQVFSQRGFLARLVSGRRDIESLEEIDKDLTKCVQDMSLALQATAISLQAVSYADMKRANEDVLKRLDELQASVCIRLIVAHLPWLLRPECWCPTERHPIRSRD
jgi:hypothetical protein